MLPYQVSAILDCTETLGTSLVLGEVFIGKVDNFPLTISVLKNYSFLSFILNRVFSTLMKLFTLANFIQYLLPVHRVIWLDNILRSLADSCLLSTTYKLARKTFSKIVLSVDVYQSE